MIRINAVWQPGGVDSVIAPGIADTLTNSGAPAGDQLAPTVTVTWPNGGETLVAGSSANILWSASDNMAVTTVDVDASSNGGSSWSSLAASSGLMPIGQPAGERQFA